jgi:hypothetical protein
MAYDAHDDGEGSPGRRRRFREFDCPECNANNPYDDGFGDGDVVLCNYCGEELAVEVREEGPPRLRAV